MKTDILAPDEAALQKPKEGETAETLLRREGVFFFKNIAPILYLDAIAIRRETRKLVAAGQNPWQTMGVRKIWSHWLVRMKIFAPNYRNRLKKRWQPIPGSWDSNRLLEAEGVFKMADVARQLPSRDASIRRQAKISPHAWDVMGVWKDPESDLFWWTWPASALGSRACGTTEE